MYFRFQSKFRTHNSTVVFEKDAFDNIHKLVLESNIMLVIFLEAVITKSLILWM